MSGNRPQVAAEVARHLRARGLGDLLTAARSRYESLEAPRGSVAVDLSAAALAELEALMGSRLRVPPAGPSSRVTVDGSRRVRVSLAALDASLRASRFDVSLSDVLAADGGPITTQRQRREAAERTWLAQLARIERAVSDEATARRWVASLHGDARTERSADERSADEPGRPNPSPGLSAARYKRLYNDDRAVAERAAVAVGRAITRLGQDRASRDAHLDRGELLAVFAADVAGDPHAFDDGTPAGSLLMAALTDWTGAPPDGLRHSESRAHLLSRVGLDVDGVSSTVLVACLRGTDHPVINAMAEHGGGWPLPLSEARHLRVASEPGATAYVVENPQVFEYLVRGIERLDVERRPALACTGGFISAAGVNLLDGLSAAGYCIQYSGDFDRNGLAIAEWVLTRYPEARPWMMSVTDYHHALGDSRLGDVRSDAGESPKRLPYEDRRWLRERQAGPLMTTAHEIADRGVAAYQERLVEQMLRHLIEEATLSAPS